MGFGNGSAKMNDRAARIGNLGAGIGQPGFWLPSYIHAAQPAPHMIPRITSRLCSFLLAWYLRDRVPFSGHHLQCTERSARGGLRYTAAGCRTSRS